MQLEQLDWRAERSEYKVGGDNILQVVVLIPLGRRYCMLKPDEKEWDRMRKRGVPRRVCTCTVLTCTRPTPLFLKSPAAISVEAAL